jgi:succinyl-diaminopimelate desuccinylase
MDEIQKILAQLIAFPSITPNDAGCQNFMIDYLESLNFSCQTFNKGPVSNFFACYGHSHENSSTVATKLLVFAGHTDVVPVGEASKWDSYPFQLEEKEGILYGRGVADMKGSLACMLVMAKRFITEYPSFSGRLGFLITSGEEGEDFDLGTPYVMEQLSRQGISIDYCIVGEPSSETNIADMIKIGRRGSLSAKIRLQGKQGHVAYPHLAENPIHKISPALAELTSIEWDKGNDHFPPTSMQITSVHSGGEAGNIIPGEIGLDLNFRYSTAQTEASLKKKLLDIFTAHDLQPLIEWRMNGQPFLTSQGQLLESCKQAIVERTGKETILSTLGGTSDGRFIAPYAVEVVELGPVNASIHQVNEWVSLEDLHVLESIYFSICEKILGTG